MKTKILFLIPSLAGGGAERVFSLLVRHLDRSSFEPLLALLKKEGPFLADIPPDVEIIDLQSDKSRYSLRKIIQLVRKRKPDIVCTTLGYLNLITLLAGLFFPAKVKTVIRESTFVSESLKLEKYGRLFACLYGWLYKRADRIICLSEAMKQDLLQQFPLPLDRISVIPNPVDHQLVNRKASAPVGDFPPIVNTSRTLISIGRLEYEKGHDLLIDALAQLERDVQLILVGTGKQRESLIEQAEKQGLAGRVHFLGFQNNPFAYTRLASLFVFPSRYEGFGSAIVEALACGLPVVSFDGPTASREIIIPGVNGFLAEPQTPEALAAAIRRALQHTFQADEIKRDARARFDVHAITSLYEAVFKL